MNFRTKKPVVKYCKIEKMEETGGGEASQKRR